MRVVILGNSGSGKSTLARALAEREGLRHLDLDGIVWEAGKVAVLRPAEAVAEDLRRFIADEPRWVIEGCYGEVAAAAAASATLFLLLDPGLEACQANNRRRPWEPHKYASAEAQDAMLPQLQAWVAGYYEREDPWSRAQHLRVFEAFPGAKEIVRDPTAWLKGQARGS